jgi:hypothetical protein
MKEVFSRNFGYKPTDKAVQLFKERMLEIERSGETLSIDNLAKKMKFELLAQTEQNLNFDPKTEMSTITPAQAWAQSIEAMKSAWISHITSHPRILPQDKLNVIARHPEESVRVGAPSDLKFEKSELKDGNGKVFSVSAPLLVAKADGTGAQRIQVLRLQKGNKYEYHVAELPMDGNGQLEVDADGKPNILGSPGAKRELRSYSDWEKQHLNKVLVAHQDSIKADSALGSAEDVVRNVAKNQTAKDATPVALADAKLPSAVELKAVESRIRDLYSSFSKGFADKAAFKTSLDTLLDGMKETPGAVEGLDILYSKMQELYRNEGQKADVEAASHAEAAKESPGLFEVDPVTGRMKPRENLSLTTERPIAEKLIMKHRERVLMRKSIHELFEGREFPDGMAEAEAQKKVIECAALSGLAQF